MPLPIISIRRVAPDKLYNCIMVQDAMNIITRRWIRKNRIISRSRPSMKTAFRNGQR